MEVNLYNYGVEIKDIEKYLMDLSMEKKIVLKESEEGLRVYVSHFYYLELNTAKMLHDLNLEYEEANVVIEKKIHQIEKEAEMQLDEKQENAVMAAVRNGIMILTGGPGTGKTTTINAMIEYFHSENMEIMLAAPTGRAAKRMTEATGWEAQTIHRLLEVNGNPEEDENPNRNGFARNADNPLETDVIIIDEMSMVDLWSLVISSDLISALLSWMYFMQYANYRTCILPVGLGANLVLTFFILVFLSLTSVLFSL